MKIFIVTERRADFSRFKPIIKIINNEKKIKYDLVVTGLHLVREHGYTINEIFDEKFKVFDKFKMFDEQYFVRNDGSSMAYALGVAVTKLSKILRKSKPDIILSGFDIAANFAVTICGAHMNIPVAHIQGGEVSGTIDESLRHGMSKFSNLHFTANNETKKRLIKMGEVPKNVYAVGCPSIDALLNEKDLSRAYILNKFKIDISKPFSITIQHPVTSELHLSEIQMKKTIVALKKIDMQHLIIFPNNDAGSKKILKTIKKSNLKFTPTLNLSEYKTLLKYSRILLGNSSSGIHEASTFKIPVINIGTRQNGRMKSKNIINVYHDEDKIFKALKKGLSKSFKNYIKNVKNPYGDGNASKKIIKILKTINFSKFNKKKKITY